MQNDQLQQQVKTLQIADEMHQSSQKALATKQAEFQNLVIEQENEKSSLVQSNKKLKEQVESLKMQVYAANNQNLVEINKNLADENSELTVKLE